MSNQLYLYRITKSQSHCCSGLYNLYSERHHLFLDAWVKWGKKKDWRNLRKQIKKITGRGQDFCRQRHSHSINLTKTNWKQWRPNCKLEKMTQTKTKKRTKDAEFPPGNKKKKHQRHFQPNTVKQNSQFLKLETFDVRPDWLETNTRNSKNYYPGTIEWEQERTWWDTWWCCRTERGRWCHQCGRSDRWSHAGCTGRSGTRGWRRTGTVSSGRLRIRPPLSGTQTHTLLKTFRDAKTTGAVI